MKKMICPQCSNESIPLFRKAHSSKWFPVKCNVCGNKFYSKLPFGFGAMKNILLHLCFIASVVVSFIYSIFLPVVLCVLFIFLVEFFVGLYSPMKIIETGNTTIGELD